MKPPRVKGSWSVPLQFVRGASRPSIFLLSLLLASCAAGKKEDKASPAASAHKPLSARLAETNGYVKDADGNWKPKSDKRSEFDSKGESPYFKGEYKKQEYKTGDFAKKSWWGSKEYERKPYTGNTDGSRFQKASRLDGQGAREAGTDARVPDPYQTGSYATGTARESTNSGIARPSDAETDSRRNVYKAPAVIDWREQRNLSLDQSRSILGR